MKYFELQEKLMKWQQYRPGIYLFILILKKKENFREFMRKNKKDMSNTICIKFQISH